MNIQNLARRNQEKINQIWGNLVFPDPDVLYIRARCVKCGETFHMKNHVGIRPVWIKGEDEDCEHEFEFEVRSQS